MVATEVVDAESTHLDEDGVVPMMLHRESEDRNEVVR